jgi:hypothetical protein
VKPGRSLLSLITFCATSVLVTTLGLILLFASVTGVLAIARTLGSGNDVDAVSASTQTPADSDASSESALDTANPIVFQGVISDDHCGPRHDMGSGRSPAECARMCVREGQQYIVVSGDKSYRLTGRDDLTVLAGERVTVTGSLTGDTIKIKSITAEQ